MMMNNDINIYNNDRNSAIFAVNIVILFARDKVDQLYDKSVYYVTVERSSLRNYTLTTARQQQQLLTYLLTTGNHD